MKNILLIFISLLIFSCSDSDDSDDLIGVIFNQETFDTKRELWKNSGIKDYSFIQQYTSLSVGGLPELITVVKDNDLDTIHPFSELDKNFSIENYPHYKTIDEVFDFIINTVEYYKSKIDSSDSVMIGAEIEVEYDENYYFPTKIRCVGHYKEDLLGGLSIHISINDFRLN